MQRNNWSWIISVIVLDQATKYFSRKYLSVIENSALPFGINLPGVFNLFAVIAALGIFIVFYRRYFDRRPQSEFGYSLIVGGAFSNIVDRIGDGRVTDFINVGISTLNLADVAIIGGIIILLISNAKILKFRF